MQKESIVQILQELAWSRSPARGFLALIESGNFSADMLQKLAHKLESALHKTKDFRLQKLFNKWKKVIQTIQEQEQHERIQEEEEISKIEEALENM